MFTTNVHCWSSKGCDRGIYDIWEVTFATSSTCASWGYVLCNRRLKTPTACRGNNPLGDTHVFPLTWSLKVFGWVRLIHVLQDLIHLYGLNCPGTRTVNGLPKKEYEGEDPFFVDTFVRWIATKRCLQNKERSCHVQAQNPSNIMWGAVSQTFSKICRGDSCDHQTSSFRT